VTTGIGAVTNTAKVQAGDNVIVFGLGGIGLNVLQAARMVGASSQAASGKAQPSAAPRAERTSPKLSIGT